MLDWWSSFTLESEIFYAIGIVALAILLLQILLTIIGIDVHHDADLSGVHDSGLSLLSIRTITAFFVGFGWGAVIRNAIGVVGTVYSTIPGALTQQT